MSPQARDATIKHFSKIAFFYLQFPEAYILTLSVNNVDVTVFLVSLKAGGVALNLTEASRVYLMDSWWNPAVSFIFCIIERRRVNFASRLNTVSDKDVCYVELNSSSTQRPWIVYIALVSADLCKPLNLLWKIVSKVVLYR